MTTSRAATRFALTSALVALLAASVLSAIGPWTELLRVGKATPLLRGLLVGAVVVAGASAAWSARRSLRTSRRAPATAAALLLASAIAKVVAHLADLPLLGALVLPLDALGSMPIAIHLLRRHPPTRSRAPTPATGELRAHAAWCTAIALLTAAALLPALPRRRPKDARAVPAPAQALRVTRVTEPALDFDERSLSHDAAK